MKQVEKQNTDIKELENHFKAINDYYSSTTIRNNRFINPELEFFDLKGDFNGYENTYRVFISKNKLLVFFRNSSFNKKFYNINQEQIKILRSYYE